MGGVANHGRVANHGVDLSQALRGPHVGPQAAEPLAADPSLAHSRAQERRQRGARARLNAGEQRGVVDPDARERQAFRPVITQSTRHQAEIAARVVSGIVHHDQMGQHIRR